MDNGSLAPQDELVLRGGIVVGGDAQERGWGPRASVPDAPEVQDLVAPLWLVGVDVDDCCCLPLGSEAPDKPPAEPLEGRCGELFQHWRHQVDLDLEVAHHA